MNDPYFLIKVFCVYAVLNELRVLALWGWIRILQKQVNDQAEEAAEPNPNVLPFRSYE